MQYVDVSEFARLTGKTEAYIRKLCRQNKLRYIQEPAEHTGRLKYLIEISSPEAQKHFYNDETGTETVSNPTQEVSQFDTGMVSELLEQFSDYIYKAGKLDAIEDKSKQQHEDLKYWQDKFFEKQNEVSELSQKVAVLVNQVSELQKQLDSEKKRPFWKKNIM